MDKSKPILNPKTELFKIIFYYRIYYTEKINPKSQKNTAFILRIRASTIVFRLNW